MMVVDVMMMNNNKYIILASTSATIHDFLYYRIY